MMRGTSIAALAMLLGACGPHDLPGYTASAGGGSRSGTTTTPPMDGGTSGDAGLPSMTCPGDADGVGAGDSIVVSELAFGSQGFLEFYNRGGTSQPLEGLRFAGSVTDLRLASSSLAPQERAITPLSLSAASGELALFDSSQTMLQYVCWGSVPVTQLQNEAISQGKWFTSGVCVTPPPDGQSLHLRGGGSSPLDYTAAAPTPLGCP